MPSPATVFTCNPTSFSDGRQVIGLAFVLLGGTAWSCPAQTMVRGDVTTAASPVPAAAVAPANYALSPNDLVEVKVFQEDDMDWTVRVTKDSTINLPLVGSVVVAHKTPAELGEVVKTKLHDGWLVHPQVTVSVLEFSKRRFTILGEVNKPGQIDFPDNAELDVLQALGMAGGYTKQANPARVYVKRRVNDREIVLTVDAKRMARREATPFKVLPGDTITVGETIF